MVLSPLAVVLLAQLGILLLGIIFYQKLQKKRLLKELENLRGTQATGHQAPELNLSTTDFDQQQVELLLNRSLQGLNDIAAEAPVVKKQCQDQQALITALADCLSIPLAQAKEAPAAKPKTAATAAAATTTVALAADTEAWATDDILTQETLDETLTANDAEDDFGLGDLDSLETSNEAEDDDLSLPGEDPEMPEDTLQATLDNLDDFDFSDLEEELLKDDGDKPKK